MNKMSCNLFDEIFERFECEETKKDKEKFLEELNDVIKTLYQELEDE